LKTYNIFYFENYSFDKNTLLATFNYSFDSELFFSESISFLDKNFSLRTNLDFEIINNVLFHIHLALWISYYKFYPTKKLVLKTGVLDEFQTKFWQKFYLNWLWEFFYKNEIDPNGLLEFSPSPNPSPLWVECKSRVFISTSPPSDRCSVWGAEKYLVPVWWWKDSIVSIELLKKMWKQIDAVTFSVDDNILYENTAKNAWINRLFIKRELSKNIREVIAYWSYNWHVPITWMIAFVLQLACYLYDYKYIILSNELSANFENTTWKWVSINHQWSKSLEFEQDFGEYVSKYISKEIKYFSLLRPFYELKIAELFAKNAKKYFSSFSSCNKNFKIFKKSHPLIPPYQGGEEILPLTPPNLPLSGEESNFPLIRGIEGVFWCNSCPKCVFVYSILRPFLTHNEIISIFGRELYEDKALETLFRELLWITWIKPFECVGTNEEVILAMKLASEKWIWKLPYILQIFKNEIDSKMNENDFELLKQKILIPNFKNNIIENEILEELKKNKMI